MQNCLELAVASRDDADMNRRFFLVYLFLFATTSVTSAEVEWGHLSGRFVYQGALPSLRDVPRSKDQAVLGDSVRDESLLINPENNGVANVVVFLSSNSDSVRVHPSYDRAADAKVRLQMKDGRFEPHVLLLRTTQTMVQVNKDRVPHHARIAFSRNHAR